MADDIVTRLRDTAYETDVCWEAATEIERLRTGLQDAWSAADMLATQLERISSGNTDVLREYDMRCEEARRD